MMQLDNRFRQTVLLLLLISPVSLFAAPYPSDSQTTIAQCQEIQCEPLSCTNPVRLDGQCCPICVEPDLTTELRSCIYEGLNIPHGDQFHPPSMLQAYEESKSVDNNQTSAVNASSTNPYCIECNCNDGSVVCNDVSTSCPALNCDAADAVVSEGSCCPSCPSVPVTPGPDVVGCYDFDGTFFSEGESWHPTLPGQGQVPCINCTCIDGETRCQKLPCPPVPTCGPDDPIEVEVLCCPKCNPPVNPLPVSTVTVPGDDTTEETPDLTPDITPCNTDKDYSIKVFKHPTLDAMAIEDTNKNTVEVYRWVQEENESGETVLKRIYEEMTSEVLYEMGGILMDTDAIAVKTFDPLLNYQAVLARDQGGFVVNGLMISQKHSCFMCNFAINSYYRYNGAWNTHSTWTLNPVWRSYKDILILKQYDGFFPFSPNEIRLQNFLLKDKTDLPDDVSNLYAVHLYHNLLNKNEVFRRIKEKSIDSYIWLKESKSYGAEVFRSVLPSNFTKDHFDTTKACIPIS